MAASRLIAWLLPWVVVEVVVDGDSDDVWNWVVAKVVPVVSFVIVKDLIISCTIGRNWSNLDSWFT